MRKTEYGLILSEAPIVHASHVWDEKTRKLVYVYNGRPLLSMTFPGTEEPGFRHTSDGDLVGAPFHQQLYFMLDTPATVEVTFQLSADAVNMRPHRAAPGQAIRGQVGRPLAAGVNGLYDIAQDLLVEWHGMAWRWLDTRLTPNGDGDLTARLEVTMGKMPWFMNVKPHFYRAHLGYTFHKPWAWRPNQKGVSGWCSWEAYRRDVTEENIDAASRLFGEKLRPYGFEYIQIDDGYERMPVPAFGHEPMPRSWLETNDQFPGGHARAIASIRDQGLEPGIWTCSAIINDDFPKAHPDDMLRLEDGTFVTGIWAGYLLSCTDAALARHIRPIYDGLKAAGYSYVKIDGVRHLLYDGLQQAVANGILTNEDAERRFRAYMQTVRDGMGNDVYLLSSWGVLSQVVGVADACRISMDANPTWAGCRMQLVESARWFHAQRILFVMDPDHICARARIEWARSVASLVSLTGGLFMLSDPLDVYNDEERIYMLQRCLPPLETTAGETGPLDATYPAFTWTKLHGFAVPRENVVQAEDANIEDAMNMAGVYPTMHEDHPLGALWSFHLERGGRQWCVAGRFATIPLRACDVPLESLGLDPAKTYHVFDFWARKPLGAVSGKLACGPLDLGHCQILALVPDAGRPQFLASTRHVSMDAISILDERWEDRILTIELHAIPNTEETYWFALPEEMALRAVDGDGVMCTAQERDAMLALTLRFEKSRCTLRLRY